MFNNIYLFGNIIVSDIATECTILESSMDTFVYDNRRLGYQSLEETSVFLWFQGGLDILQGHGMPYLKIFMSTAWKITIVCKSADCLIIFC